MARKYLIAGVAAISLVVAVPMARADYPVFDGTMVGKAIEQIKEMKASVAAELQQLAELKESVMFLNDISKFVNEVSDAIGEITNITLPIPNIMKMQAQIKSDIRCLMPDGMGWGIKFTDLNLASICETSGKYRDALFVNQDKLANLPFNEQKALRHAAAAHRSALLADTSVRSLAQADVQLQQAEKLSDAADDLQANLGQAKTVQERLHVQAQTEILQARAMASQNQLLAQMLKLQAAGQIKAGLPVDDLKLEEEGDQ
ncbi:conserved secreted protein of unknown function [Magnetospirillum gryphiswaldense MSR-1 v2]|uniref:Secreted protein n=1 Tax=Magnetospirillum gryphiswaldense (strain DSM 6361 / JCM 21280 / NBRC 15271 / MSR-1) TaxID=431944 RepID=V6F195_MAGGM|nr:hypothetical protein [Magnetospirillum gryphiswaldense]CDK99167.1 conserved secreted protein of unknown function [Magnetospirillum gryphiswaldense MSR-1 v2]